MAEDETDNVKASKGVKRSKTTKPIKSEAASDSNQAEKKSSRSYTTLPANSRLEDPGTAQLSFNSPWENMRTL